VSQTPYFKLAPPWNLNEILQLFLPEKKCLSYNKENKNQFLNRTSYSVSWYKIGELSLKFQDVALACGMD